MNNTLQADHWLKMLSPEARAEVQRIVNSLDKHRTGPALDWWIKYSPTTTTPRNVTLFRKVDGQIVWKRQIMLNGELCE